MKTNFKITLAWLLSFIPGTKQHESKVEDGGTIKRRWEAKQNSDPRRNNLPDFKHIPTPPPKLSEEQEEAIEEMKRRRDGMPITDWEYVKAMKHKQFWTDTNLGGKTDHLDDAFEQVLNKGIPLSAYDWPTIPTCKADAILGCKCKPGECIEYKRKQHEHHDMWLKHGLLFVDDDLEPLNVDDKVLWGELERGWNEIEQRYHPVFKIGKVIYLFDDEALVRLEQDEPWPKQYRVFKQNQVTKVLTK